MPRLSDDDVRAELAGDLPGWEFDGEAIRKEFVFKGFMAAIAFIDRLAPKAHDEAGVTEHDIALARAIESVIESTEA